MKLTDLEPELLCASFDGALWHTVKAVEDAQGLSFYCPRCQDTRVLVWFADRGVTDQVAGGGARWSVSGTGLDDLTLTPSILTRAGGCAWHGFVTDGEIVTC